MFEKKSISHQLFSSKQFSLISRFKNIQPQQQQHPRKKHGERRQTRNKRKPKAGPQISVIFEGSRTRRKKMEGGDILNKKPPKKRCIEEVSNNIKSRAGRPLVGGRRARADVLVPDAWHNTWKEEPQIKNKTPFPLWHVLFVAFSFELCFHYRVDFSCNGSCWLRSWKTQPKGDGFFLVRVVLDGYL